MPNQSVRVGFEPESTFRELEEQMKRLGLPLMYPFRMDTDRDKYHVSAQYARETSRLFYRPDAGFLVNISLAEQLGEDGNYSSWWSCHLYLSLDDTSMIRHEVFNVCPGHTSEYMFDCEPLEHMLGDIAELVSPWRLVGGSVFVGVREWELEAHLGIPEIVSMLERVLRRFDGFFLPKLGDGRGISVFSLTNNYAWPHCRERYWRSFPTRILRERTNGRIRGRESISPLTGRRS